MPFMGTLSELHAMLMGLDPVLLAIVAGLAVALETSAFVGLLIPGEIILLVAATAAVTPGRFVAVLAAGVVGSVVGEAVGYLLGRHGGARLRRSRLGRRIGEARWAATDARLHRYGPRAILFARFTPIVHALVPVLVGNARLPFRRFVAWCVAAGAIWSSVYVAAGAFAGTQLDRFGASIGLLGYAVGAAILAVLGLRWWWRRRTAAVDPAVRPGGGVSVYDDKSVARSAELVSTASIGGAR